MDKQQLNYYMEINGNISLELKRIVLSQYNDKDTLYIYCDGSRKRKMGAGICYIYNTKVIVRGKNIKVNKDYKTAMYAELYSIYLAVSNFQDIMNGKYNNVVIYTDVTSIHSAINQNRKFNNKNLQY